MTVRLFSFGGGVQSTAALVLAAQGRIDYRIFVHADVGEDSEHPAAVAYIRDVAVPFAAAHGIDLRVVRRVKRDGSTPTLLQDLYASERSIIIPMRMANGAPGNRTCTATYKIKPVAKEAKRLGATRAAPATIGIGISTDEWMRAKDSRIPYLVNDWPLLDLRLSRVDCLRIVAEAGLPTPPKSACWFCPYHRKAEWKRMRADEPDLFAASAKIEADMIERRRRLGKDPVYMTSACVSLDEAIKPDDQRAMFDDDGRHDCGPFVCDGGRDDAELVLESARVPEARKEES